MTGTLRSRARVFQIAYKSFYHEFSDWNSEYINAATKKAALRVFAFRHNVGFRENKSPQNWRWWDGEWYMSFRFIREVAQKPKVCPRCHGTGSVVDGEV
jgi:hypothetical protein